jgi:uncharacterized protein YbaR (Trm112 family)
VNLDPVLLEILVCPDCKGSLTVDQDRDELVCNGCGLAYPVRDNIPIMLVDEARKPAPAKKATGDEAPAVADPDSSADSGDDAG